MPTTSPSALTSGPPELPGLAAASNWMRLLHALLAFLREDSRARPETTPERDRRADAERKADRDHLVAGAKVGGRAQRRRHEVVGQDARPDDREVVLGPRADDDGLGLGAVGEDDLELLRRRRDVQVGEDRALVDDDDAGADRGVLLVEVFLDPLGRRGHFDRRFRLPRLGRLRRPVVGRVGVQRVSRLEPVHLDDRGNDPRIGKRGDGRRPRTLVEDEVHSIGELALREVLLLGLQQVIHADNRERRKQRRSRRAPCPDACRRPSTTERPRAAAASGLRRSRTAHIVTGCGRSVRADASSFGRVALDRL